MILSSENRLMELCSRVTMDKERQERAREILKDNLDWGYIMKRAPDEGIAPLLFFNLNRIDEANRFILFEIKQVLEREYVQTSFRNVIFLEALSGVLRAFKEADVSAIPLKGGFLIENIYKDFGLRPMSDVDILVKKSELLKVHHSLNQLGYVSSFSLKDIEDYQNSTPSAYINSIVYIKNDNLRLCLNLHWHLANSIFPIYIDTNINMDKIWQDAQSSGDTLVMAPHHLLIHLAEHAFRHCFNRLILLTDIAEVVRIYKNNIDWENFIRDSFGFGLERQIFYSLYLASDRLGAEIPKTILTTLSPKRKGFGEKVFLGCLLKNKRFEELSCLLLLSICKSIGHKARFLWRLIFPPRQVLAQAYLKEIRQINLFHYLFRIFRGAGYIKGGLIN